jgi:hypothetical protein
VVVTTLVATEVRTVVATEDSTETNYIFLFSFKTHTNLYGFFYAIMHTSELSFRYIFCKSPDLILVKNWELNAVQKNANHNNSKLQAIRVYMKQSLNK